MKAKPAIARFRLALILAAAALLARPAAADLRCDMIPNLMRGYYQNHVRFNERSDEIERRTIETYVRRLDASRTLLLASEEASMRASLRGIFDDLAKGDCSPPRRDPEDADPASRGGREVRARHGERSQLRRRHQRRAR